MYSQYSFFCFILCLFFFPLPVILHCLLDLFCEHLWKLIGSSIGFFFSFVKLQILPLYEFIGECFNCYHNPWADKSLGTGGGKVQLTKVCSLRRETSSCICITLSVYVLPLFNTSVYWMNSQNTQTIVRLCVYFRKSFGKFYVET